jgi:hypothetical protein
VLAELVRKPTKGIEEGLFAGAHFVKDGLPHPD